MSRQVLHIIDQVLPIILMLGEVVIGLESHLISDGTQNKAIAYMDPLKKLCSI